MPRKDCHCEPRQLNDREIMLLVGPVLGYSIGSLAGSRLSQKQPLPSVDEVKKIATAAIMLVRKNLNSSAQGILTSMGDSALAEVLSGDGGATVTQFAGPLNALFASKILKVRGFHALTWLLDNDDLVDAVIIEVLNGMREFSGQIEHYQKAVDELKKNEASGSCSET